MKADDFHSLPKINFKVLVGFNIARIILALVKIGLTEFAISHKAIRSLD